MHIQKKYDIIIIFFHFILVNLIMEGGMQTTSTDWI